MFSNPTSSAFSFSAPSNTQSTLFSGQQQQQAQPLQQQQALASLASHPFQYIQQSFDSNSLGYRFRAIFYNLLPPNQSASAVSKPANVPDRLWNQAVSENPDGQRCVPVIANGPGDLDARGKWQQEYMQACTEKSADLLNRLDALTDATKSNALQRVRERQAKLNERLLRVQARLEPLKRLGVRLDQNEQQVGERLKGVQKQMAENAQVEGVVDQLRALLKDGRIDLDAQLRDRVISDPKVVQELADLLNTQSSVLIKSVERVTAMNKSLDTMLSGYSL